MGHSERMHLEVADRLTRPGAAESEIPGRQRVGVGEAEKAIAVDPIARDSLLGEYRDVIAFVGLQQMRGVGVFGNEFSITAGIFPETSGLVGVAAHSYIIEPQVVISGQAAVTRE